MIALALQVTAAFNLVCTGTSHFHDLTSANWLSSPGQQFTTVIRVDLERRRWCAGACPTTHRLENVTDTTITLQYVRDPTADAPFIVSSLNRETGRYFHSMRLGKTWALRNARCEVAPFGGFPERRF
jgi:hypothetical protein